MKTRKITPAFLLFALLMFAAGCSSLYANAPASINPPTGYPSTIPSQIPSLVPNGAPQSHPMIPYTGTSIPSSGTAISGGLTSAGGLPTPPDLSTPLVPDTSGNLDVTLPDNGRTVLMQVGQRFLLDLGDTYDWNLNIVDQNIVSRVLNIMTIRGSQGLFEAHTTGTTTLQATGDPLCRQSQPACMMPSVLFQVTITVN